jgi:two-component system LytT family response regulator
MRALIVDDEPLARRGVRVRLQRLADVEIVGECGDGHSAIEQILALAPDVVFLDVQMPGLDGFEVLRNLPGAAMPAIVFLTAYEKHAVRAFEMHALDYLVKPLDDQRFAAAVERVRGLLDTKSRLRIAERVGAWLTQHSDRYPARFNVRSGSRLQIVLSDEIDWVGGARDYAELHVRGRAYLLRETMRSLGEKLNPEKFMRIHRSRIVRKACIREFRSIENREYRIKLSDGSEHRSSRTYAEEIDAWLSGAPGS